MYRRCQNKHHLLQLTLYKERGGNHPPEPPDPPVRAPDVRGGADCDGGKGRRSASLRARANFAVERGKHLGFDGCDIVADG
jgi:hypothetical protein